MGVDLSISDSSVSPDLAASAFLLLSCKKKRQDRKKATKESDLQVKVAANRE